jgi:ligand-binding SRPBCC domain-containing protein
MVRVSYSILIAASPERCFDLARDMAVHVQTLGKTGERIVAGKSDGLLELGDEVTFEGTHFGVRQRLSAKIVAFDRPQSFTDQMTKGAFRSLTHTHSFAPGSGGTLMTDEVVLEAPLGPLGRLAERVFLKSYMRRLLENRGKQLKRIAESNDSSERRRAE